MRQGKFYWKSLPHCSFFCASLLKPTQNPAILTLSEVEGESPAFVVVVAFTHDS